MRKLLIANRGEIAVRIIASAALEGLATVAVYTHDDRGCAHVARADEAFPLPGTGAAGYLDTGAVIAAALTAGADAIHPGYGFFAENAGFARHCAERGVAFVGPPPQALEAFGDKSRARALAAEGAHVAITGGMAASDSLVQQVLGHGIAAKLSQRLGEGILNGLLTARLGLAAIDVTRPLPFTALPRPALGDLAKDLLRKREDEE